MFMIPKMGNKMYRAYKKIGNDRSNSLLTGDHFNHYRIKLSNQKTREWHNR